MEQTAKCYICKKIKLKSEFYKDSARDNRVSSTCKKCSHTYERRKKSLATYRGSHLNDIKARTAVKKALKIGLLEKEPCIICQEPKVHAHHFKGYNKEHWLDIIWLCQEHHRQAHHD